jgi:hypothetical protein
MDDVGQPLAATKTLSTTKHKKKLKNKKQEVEAYPHLSTGSGVN